MLLPRACRRGVAAPSLAATRRWSSPLALAAAAARLAVVVAAARCVRARARVAAWCVCVPPGGAACCDFTARSTCVRRSLLAAEANSAHCVQSFHCLVHECLGVLCGTADVASFHSELSSFHDPLKSSGHESPKRAELRTFEVNPYETVAPVIFPVRTSQLIESRKLLFFFAKRTD